MVQGGKKISNIRPGEVKKSTNSAKVMKKVKREQQAKKGNPLKLPRTHFRDEALDDRELSKAIDKSNEQKMAAKALQSGMRVGTKDLLAKGKELNREERRKLLKNKVSRVEEKLRELERKDKDGGGLL